VVVAVVLTLAVAVEQVVIELLQVLLAAVHLLKVHFH
jgi:hypothetical protein